MRYSSLEHWRTPFPILTRGWQVDHLRVVRRDIYYVPGPDLEIERKRRRRCRRDIGEAEHEGRCAIAGHAVAAVEQLRLDLGGARHGQAEGPQRALSHVFDDVGLGEGAAKGFAGEAYLFGRIL